MRPRLYAPVIGIILCSSLLAYGNYGDETYRIVNSSETQIDLLVKGNGNDYVLSLKPRTWCSVAAEGEIEKRVIVWRRDPEKIRAYSHIRFDRIPDEHGIGIPIIYIDDSKNLHLLRLGKGSLVLLDRISNDVLNNRAVPSSYMQNKAKKHIIYSEKDLTKR